MKFKIATWNVNSVNARLEHLIHFLENDAPDIVLLQEIKCVSEKFPSEALAHLPYNISIMGQKSYHGVAILSKFPLEEIAKTFPNNPLPDEARFLEVGCKIGEEFYRIISLYAPNGAEAGSNKYALKLEFYDALQNYLSKIVLAGENAIIAGDFNIAPFDLDVYDPKDLEGVTSFTEPEKERLRSILNNGFTDLYRVTNPLKKEFSWWDYRNGGLQKNEGMRIDLILGTKGVLDRLIHCDIDKKHRLKMKPSDHTVVFAEIKI